ncbi:MAG TPA: amidohydrolase family protein [Phycisphaerales bacterium]|nr:amidohydrolase family protein [Phycisphaerales bacterium]
MTPRIALREAHAHIPAHGRELTTLPLADCTSIAECIDRVRTEAARLDTSDPSRSRWLIANGVRVEAWHDRAWPTRDQLNHACPNRPAILMGFDYHSLLANTPAFRAANIADNAVDPAGGVVVRDKQGSPTGVLLEAACRIVREAMPQPTPVEQREITIAALRDFASHGFVEVHDLLAPDWLGSQLAALHDEGLLQQLGIRRVCIYPLVEDLPRHAAASATWQRGDTVILAGGKVFVDGTLNSRTAWMLEPFRNPLPDHPCGTPLMSVDQIATAMRICEQHNVGFAAHAIGDAAVRAVLDAAQRISRPAADITNPRSAVRIEHCELTHPRDIPRFAQLGVIASVQPCHLLYDIEVLERELADRLDRVLPMRDWIATGLVPGKSLVFGSDAPIVRPHPRDSIIAAVHRRRTSDAPGGPPTQNPIATAQALSESAAWQAFM